VRYSRPLITAMVLTLCNKTTMQKQKSVVLENNNGHLTQRSAEELPIFRSSLQQEARVSCQRVGPGEPGSAAVPSVRPSAWCGLGLYAPEARHTPASSRHGRSTRRPSAAC